MKNLRSIAMALSLLLMLSACSKKNDPSPEELGNAKINQIITSFSNQTPRVENISYDAQDRNTEWKYDGLRIYREFDDSNNIRVGKFLYQYILDNGGRAIEATSQTLSENYRRKFTYDGQNRITKITIEEQYVSSKTGSPNTNFKLSDTYDLTWNNESNITSIRRTYTGDGNTGGVGYWVYNFEGYSSERPNTLKPGNIGLNIFGSQGYPAIMDGGGGGGLIFRPFFAGAQLPAKVSMQAFAKNNDVVGPPIITNYTIEKNAQGRISLLDYDGVTYRFNYR